MTDQRRQGWMAFGSAVCLTMVALILGWYGSGRNGIGVKNGKLVSSHASLTDPFLWPLYVFAGIGLYLAVAGLTASWWLPGVSKAESAERIYQRHRDEVGEMLAWRLKTATEFSEGQNASFDPDSWERRTYDLIEKAFGLDEAEMFRNESGQRAFHNIPGKRMVDLRTQRLHELLMRFPQLDIRRDFHPVTWAMIENPPPTP